MNNCFLLCVGWGELFSPFCGVGALQKIQHAMVTENNSRTRLFASFIQSCRVLQVIASDDVSCSPSLVEGLPAVLTTLELAS